MILEAEASTRPPTMHCTALTPRGRAPPAGQVMCGNMVFMLGRQTNTQTNKGREEEVEVALLLPVSSAPEDCGIVGILLPQWFPIVIVLISSSPQQLLHDVMLHKKPPVSVLPDRGGYRNP